MLFRSVTKADYQTGIVISPSFSLHTGEYCVCIVSVCLSERDICLCESAQLVDVSTIWVFLACRRVQVCVLVSDTCIPLIMKHSVVSLR